MGDHLVLDVDRLVKPVTGEPVKVVEHIGDPSSSTAASMVVVVDGNEGSDDEEAPLLALAECRICQEEDSVQSLETPCGCSGSLKYAHRKCVQHWCDEKGDIICEICHQPYQPGYIAPPPRPRPEETTIDIGGGWQISGTPLDLHDPRLLAIADAERQFLEAEYDEYNATNASGAAFCRSAALILMALLLLRHAVSVPDADGEEDASTFFTEAAALAATQFAIVLQSGQSRGLQFTISSAPNMTPNVAPQQENV